jgi:hypothetical protein
VVIQPKNVCAALAKKTFADWLEKEIALEITVAAA